MKNIMNMEYSLNTILYLVELQIKEGLQSDFIRYKETYPFCDGIEYKKSILEYLVKYNNDNLQKVLNKHISICHSIVGKWDDELYPLSRSMMGKFDVQGYNIYCTLIQNSSYPFSDLELIRENNNVCESGNRYIENNRYWYPFDISKLNNEYYDESKTHKIPQWELKADVRNIFTYMLIEFVCSVGKFLVVL